MLHVEGSIETARQCMNSVQAEDRRVDLIVQELDRYDIIRVVALQETKWYESAVYHVGSSVLLTAGRPTPASGEQIQQREGVTIVLSGPAIAAWRAAGERWKAWSSRLVSDLYRQEVRRPTTSMCCAMLPHGRPAGQRKMCFSKI